MRVHTHTCVRVHTHTQTHTDTHTRTHTHTHAHTHTLTTTHAPDSPSSPSFTTICKRHENKMKQFTHPKSTMLPNTSEAKPYWPRLTTLMIQEDQP